MTTEETSKSRQFYLDARRNSSTRSRRLERKRTGSVAKTGLRRLASGEVDQAERKPFGPSHSRFGRTDLRRRGGFGSGVTASR